MHGGDHYLLAHAAEVLLVEQRPALVAHLLTPGRSQHPPKSNARKFIGCNVGKGGWISQHAAHGGQ